MTSHGVAPVPLVPMPRVGTVRVARQPFLAGLRAVARLGLAALIVMAMVGSAFVVTARTGIPLHALAAARTAAGFPDPVVGTRSFRSVATPPVLKTGTMALPLAGAGAEARENAGAVVENIVAQREAEQAAAAARAAARRAAAKAAAQRLAAQRAAQRAAAEKAAQQQAAREEA